jgi:hypothetical protein
MGIDKLDQAAKEMDSWKDWYSRHQAIIDDIFGEDAKLFKTILSATSQASGVAANVSLALKAYQQMVKGEPFVGYLPAVIKNLERIRAEQELFGPKIHAFGGANDGKEDEIAVDRHIAQLFFNVQTPNKSQIQKAKLTINKIAKKLGWAPRDVQASLWAYNQIRTGHKPESVRSYDTILNDRKEEIRKITAALHDIRQGHASSVTPNQRSTSQMPPNMGSTGSATSQQTHTPQ